MTHHLFRHLVTVHDGVEHPLPHRTLRLLDETLQQLPLQPTADTLEKYHVLGSARRSRHDVSSQKDSLCSIGVLVVLACEDSSVSSEEFVNLGFRGQGLPSETKR